VPVGLANTDDIHKSDASEEQECNDDLIEHVCNDKSQGTTNQLRRSSQSERSIASSTRSIQWTGRDVAPNSIIISHAKNGSIQERPADNGRGPVVDERETRLFLPISIRRKLFLMRF
jgi:hypothetical protein